MEEIKQAIKKYFCLVQLLFFHQEFAKKYPINDTGTETVGLSLKATQYQPVNPFKPRGLEYHKSHS